MGRRFISPFARTLLLLLFLCPISMASFHFKALESASTSFRSPAGRSLLSLSHSTALIAALDGTIHLVDTHSDRVIWSFASGPPIYSSYHQPFDDTHDSSSAFYIDCGHDWDLYMHTPYLGTTKLPVSIEDLIKSTPFLSADGAVTLGSKNTTVFEVDPKLGRLMRTYTSSDSPSALKSAEDDNAYASATASDTELVRSDSNAKLRLQIIRTDYALKSFAPNSDEVSWNMTVAEIVAALFCPGVDNPSGADPLNSKDMLGGGDDIALPLPCQSKAFVFRHRTVRPEGLTRVGDQENSKDGMRPLPPLKSNGSGLENDQNGRFQHHGNELSNVFGWSSALCLALSAGVLLGIVLYRFALSFKVKLVLQEQTKNCNSKASCSKRKKNRKLEKNNGVVDEKNKQVSSDDQDVEGTWLHLNKRFDCGAEGWRRIGKLVVSTTEIAKGSNGTVVLEGIHEGRRVAVKRLVQAHHDVAFKEIQNLIASDSHPNIVRWYGVEYDQDFVYLSLERCTCSLDDLVQIYSFSPQNPSFGKHNATTASMEYKVRLESMKNIVPKVNLWKANGQPSLLLLKLMRDIVSGLAHLHELGILHRDLKPQNVLISTERSLCAKLSDMGISKRLIGDVSSLGRHATGCGTSGWQAPEQLLQGRQTRAVDLFSLGCILFFCITGGRHPFGDRLERDINIVKNHMDLFLVECIPEAIDLISRLLNPDPELRLKASNVLDHPLFWDSETRLSFLRDTSDRVELEDRESSSGLLKALEGIAPIALGAKWDEKMEPAFIANIGHYRRYKFDSVRDLLRVMRNKLNHYRELPKEIQDLVGTVPEGFDGYFASRFPRLLIEVYKVIYSYCKEEECFQKYYRSNAE